MPGSVPGEEMSPPATSFERMAVQGVALEPCAGVTTGPSETPSPAALDPVTVEALRPFAAVAEHDIGESETDEDIYQPMSSGNNRAPLITVGDLRRAKAALAGSVTSTDSTWQPIETAPKDTDVLVVHDGDWVSEAYYNGESNSWWLANTAEHDFDPSSAIYPKIGRASCRERVFVHV
jgi:hypothetical protein